jgi:hypothetical protein
MGKRPFSFPMRPDRLWGPPSLLFSGYRYSFLGVNWPGGVMLTTHLYPVRRLKRVELHLLSPVRIHCVNSNKFTFTQIYNRGCSSGSPLHTHKHKCTHNQAHRHTNTQTHAYINIDTNTHTHTHKNLLR